MRYEPSPPEVVRAMLGLAGVGANDVVYDLGCGDGRIVIEAARRGARGVCVDIDPQRINEARANAGELAPRIEFRQEDLLRTEIAGATVVTLFLSPDLNLKLRQRLERELRTGTRIVSHWHRMGDWEPERMVHVQAPFREHPVYLWVIRR